jgi:mRNA interferase MazF
VTSQFSIPAHPRTVPIPTGRKTGLEKPSAVVLNHIRSVDRQRLIKRQGVVDAVSLNRIDDALKISLGL